MRTEMTCATQLAVAAHLPRHACILLKLVLSILTFALFVRGTTQDIEACGCFLQRNTCTQLTGGTSLQCEADVSYDLQRAASVGQYYAVYAGDSILRGTFASLVVTLGGASVSSREVLSFDLAWYHKDQYFCCMSMGSTPQCVWGRQGLEFNNTAHEVAAHSFERGARFCAIFVWSPSQPAVDLLQLRNVQTLRPDMIVVNPGLHHLKFGSLDTKDAVRNVVESTYAFLEGTPLQNRSRPPPWIIFQDTTSVIDTVIQDKYPKYAERFNNARICQYNLHLREEISRVTCKSTNSRHARPPEGPTVKSGYVRAYSMTSNAPKEQRKDDGVHFNRVLYMKFNSLYFAIARREHFISIC